eukprot:gnl/TRDRNA2_/TRDRNA2_35850_c0_seq1.p1 gnl/TRDRNA2_/TRDRNA2_35850_c0~~gnl/TRDRNA2_/TRDRNA2_35850_c0_seq1.p1  ORF type:complete len:177 (+),score=19.75 gnl/TRDRNA2_/TRDRNA2_35850_c0_seq1:48-578(+)
MIWRYPLCACRPSAAVLVALVASSTSADAAALLPTLSASTATARGGKRAKAASTGTGSLGIVSDGLISAGSWEATASVPAAIAAASLPALHTTPEPARGHEQKQVLRGNLASAGKAASTYQDTSPGNVLAKAVSAPTSAHDLLRFLAFYSVVFLVYGGTCYARVLLGQCKGCSCLR